MRCVAPQSTVFTFLWLLVAAWNSLAKEYIVQPSDETGSCPPTTQLCHTLAHYLNNSSTFFAAGAVFTLLPGIHSLPERADKRAFVIRDTRELTFRGQSGRRVVIRCSGSVGLVFKNISGVSLEGIAVESCGVELARSLLSKSDKVDTTLLGHGTPLRAGVILSFISNLTLSELSVCNSTGYGMIAVNLLGNTIISSVTFSRNNFQTLQDPLCTTTLSQHCKGGNLLLVFTDLQSSCPHVPPTHTVTIRDSTFNLGADLTPAYHPFLPPDTIDTTPFLGGAGVGVTLAQSDYGVEIIIDNSTLAENFAYVGSNLYMSIFDYVDNSSIVIQHSRIQYGNALLNQEMDVSLTGTFVLATGFFLAYGLIPPDSYATACTASRKVQNEIFKIESCDISYNRGNVVSAGLIYLWSGSFLQDSKEISINGTLFHENRGDSTIGIFEITYSVGSLPFKLFFSNSVFKNNESPMHSSVTQTFRQEIVVVNSVSYSQFSNCLFADNIGSAIRIVDSTVFLSGTNRFSGNVASVGAGLHLEQGSTLYLEPKSITSFQNNRALTFGGAIYAAIVSYKCFYQVLSASSEEYPQLYFQNNSAESAGNAIYGNIDTCLLENFIKVTETDTLFSNITTFVSHPKQGSLISSTGRRLCRCPGQGQVPNCTSTESKSIAVYPGQEFTLTVAVRGYNGHFGEGFTPATIHTMFVKNNSFIGLATNQMVQQISQGCSNLTYNLYTQPQTVAIVLIPTVGWVFYTLQIDVTLIPCPVGFRISNGTHEQCICNNLLEQRGLSCEINTQKVSRYSDLWIGITNHTIPPAATVAFCPLTYCKQNTFLVNLNNSDEQCDNNRSGILCGACRDGFSLALGTSRCLQCSNIYLLLLVVFAVFGVLLIVLLSILNLTVASGMINALLFYVNIIKVTNLASLPTEPSFLFPFSLFVNWLNLDFGIETCFYNGFDVYTKSWLQYAFSFYLFFLMGVAIFVSRRSTKLSKVLPRNIVSVFATVMLISYTKLLRIYVDSFQFVRLYISNTSHYVTWHYDGSILYFGVYHAPLALFSLLFFFSFTFPYIFLLTIHPFLQQLTAHEGTKVERFFAWTKRQLFHWKPIFDAYNAPFMNNCRYWTGLLLILRIVILLAAADSIGPSSYTYIIIVVTSLVLLGMVLTLGIYEEKSTRVLECAHYINLALLEFLTLILGLTRSSETAKAAVLSASIGFSFLLFICTTCIQVWLKLQNCMKQTSIGKRKRKTHKSLLDESISTDEGEFHTSYHKDTPVNKVTHSSFSITDECAEM